MSSSSIKMATTPSNLFRSSLVLIDETDGRVLDVLTQQHEGNDPHLQGVTPSISASSQHLDRPADWTSSDISLRTIIKPQPQPAPSSNGDNSAISENPSPDVAPDTITNRFLTFRRNEDFARTLAGSGWRRTTFYTDARTSVASFFTAYDDGCDGPDNDHTAKTKKEVDPHDSRPVGGNDNGGHEAGDVGGGNRGDRKSIELFSRPHPDDFVTQSETGEADEPEPIDASPDTSKVADTAYLDRFWSTLFANTDKGKTDESWIVTVSLDMSKWFISSLASLASRTSALLVGSTSRAEGDSAHGFPGTSPIREPSEEDLGSIPLSPTTMISRNIALKPQAGRLNELGSGEERPMEMSRLGLWYIQEDGTPRQIWAGNRASEMDGLNELEGTAR